MKTSYDFLFIGTDKQLNFFEQIFYLNYIYLNSEAKIQIYLVLAGGII